MGIEFNNQQIYTLYDAENWWKKANDQLYEISGAAGTGKTTLVRYLIERIGLDLSEVAFVAYMGKAAMQLARNGLPARTIHSLIYEFDRVLDYDENGKIKLLANGKPKLKLECTLKHSIGKHIKLIVIDEAGMVNEEIGTDILSYGIPTITLGDLNQLPPVFGKSFFLRNPNAILTQIMRQAENDPIVWLAHQILNDEALQIGVYGNSSVINKNSLNEFLFNKADVVLTCTNKLRGEVNTLFRENIKHIRRLDMPEVGEKIICRRNNWDRCIGDSIYLTNGTSGTIDYVDPSSYNKKSILIDFKPDFIGKRFKNIKLDYERLMTPIGSEIVSDPFSFTREQFEFAYAITTHLSQGSQYGNVLFLSEGKMGLPKDDFKRLQYTAVTRATQSITVAI